MLDAVWKFLANPDNQATLAWLGGGVVVVAGGLWKVFGGKPKDGGGKPPAVSADRGGVASGGDMTGNTITTNAAPGKAKK